MERQTPPVAEIQWHCLLMGIKPYKNKLQIIVKLCDVLSAKEGITGVLLEQDALAVLRRSACVLLS